MNFGMHSTLYCSSPSEAQFKNRLNCNDLHTLELRSRSICTLNLQFRTDEFGA